MKKGDMVKYKDPVDINEQDERFVILEDIGDRVLVGSLFLNLTFGATTVLKTDDLAIAIPYDEGKEAGLMDATRKDQLLRVSPYPEGTQERLEWNRGYNDTGVELRG